MKKQFLLIAVIIATIFGYSVQAQVQVSVNLGLQPVWGPVGYDYVDYYYMPDIDAYYDVNREVYVYFEANQWVTRRVLPPRYRNYDLYHGYKVVVNEPRPWMHHDRYHTQYISYRGRHDQQIIRESRDERYYANPHHPQHATWQSHNPGHRTDAPRQVQPGRRQGPERHTAPQQQRRHDDRQHDGGKHDGGRGHDKGQKHDDGGPGNGHH